MFHPALYLLFSCPGFAIAIYLGRRRTDWQSLLCHRLQDQQDQKMQHSTCAKLPQVSAQHSASAATALSCWPAPAHWPLGWAGTCSSIVLARRSSTALRAKATTGDALTTVPQQPQHLHAGLHLHTGLLAGQVLLSTAPGTGLCNRGVAMDRPVVFLDMACCNTLE